MSQAQNTDPEIVNRFERERRAVAREARVVFVIVLVLALLIYLFSGLTAIGQDEVALHFRLGELVDQQGPGLHLNWPWPIDEAVRLPNRNAARKVSVNSFNLRATGELNEIANRLSKKYKHLSRAFWSAAFDPYLITCEPESRHLEREISEGLDISADDAASGLDRPDITTRNVMHMGVDLNFRIEDPQAWLMQTADEPEQIIHDHVTSELIHYAAKEHIDTLLHSALVQVRRELRDVFQGTLGKVNTTVTDLAEGVLPEDASDLEVRRVFFPEEFHPQDIPPRLRDSLPSMLREVAASKPLRAELRHLAGEAVRVRLTRGSLAEWWRTLKASRTPRFRRKGGLGIQLERSGGVNILDPRVPEYVAPSFERVTRARVQQGRVFNEASREAQQIIAGANIRATEIEANAKAEAHRIKALAKAEAEGFKRLAVEYKKNAVEFRRRRSQEVLRQLAPLLRGRIINMTRDPNKKIILRLDQTGGGLDLPAMP